MSLSLIIAEFPKEIYSLDAKNISKLVLIIYTLVTELFDQKDKIFCFDAHNVTLTCERLDLPRYVAFRVVFSSKREPIVVARAKGVERPFFWTSIPEGRQKEAEGVGKLIEGYLLDKA